MASHNDQWLTIAIDSESDLSGAELLRPSVWWLTLGGKVRVEMVKRLCEIADFQVVLMELRAIGARSAKMAEPWGRSLAREVGHPLWVQAQSLDDVRACFWASVVAPAGVDAVARELNRTTAYRDALLWIPASSDGLSPEAAVSNAFLKCTAEAFDGPERIHALKKAAISSTATVFLELRDADRNFGLAAINALGRFTAELDQSPAPGVADSLHPGRFWPALAT